MTGDKKTADKKDYRLEREFMNTEPGGTRVRVKIEADVEHYAESDQREVLHEIGAAAQCVYMDLARKLTGMQ